MGEISRLLWALALVEFLTVNAPSISVARAEETCRNHESRISELGKRVADLKKIISQMLIPPVPIKACSDSTVNLRSATAGFRCRTSKGSIFERVDRKYFGEAWKGPDGLIWSDFIGRHSQYGAIATCKNLLLGTLPSRADFERGEANGFREVLPGMRGRWFWSSSVHPDKSYNAHGFNGDNGSVEHRSDGFDSVRCAGR